LWKCQGLSQLSVEGNLLKTIPSGISSLKELSTFDIGKNPMESIPIKELLNMQSLRQIGIVSRREFERRREQILLDKSKDQKGKTEIKDEK
jgi:Leucine-rich repeat (LRR) protein